jgi:hypothetical protein
MTIVVGALIVGMVLALAALVLAREQRRWVVDPRPAVFDIDDAVSWVAQRLPDAVTAQLSYDDVRIIIELQVEYFARKGSSTNGSSPKAAATVVVGGSETVDFILEQTARRLDPFTPEQVYAVVEAQLAYLREIGAIGGPADSGGIAGPGGDR